MTKVPLIAGANPVKILSNDGDVQNNGSEPVNVYFALTGVVPSLEDSSFVLQPGSEPTTLWTNTNEAWAAVKGLSDGQLDVLEYV